MSEHPLAFIYKPGTLLVGFSGTVIHNAMSQQLLFAPIRVIEMPDDFSNDVLWVEYMRGGVRHEGYVDEAQDYNFIDVVNP